MKLINVLTIGLAVAATSACTNRDVDFPDYDQGTAAYFAQQFPVKTVCLGESETFSTELDNAHQVDIYATMGGSYKGRNAVADIAVDNSLVKNLWFDEAATIPVKAMPADYYQLLSNQINYNGDLMGAVRVQLTDKFFADKDAVNATYVIPVVMNSVQGIDRVLAGKRSQGKDNASRLDAANWDEAPKDYTLFCVKYINEWTGSYAVVLNDKFTLADNSKVDSVSTTWYGDQNYGETVIEVCGTTNLATVSLNECIFTKTFSFRKDKSKNGKVEDIKDVKIRMVNKDGNWTLSSATEGVTVTGKGTFAKDTDNKWGNKQRDAFTLDYTVTFATGSAAASCTSKDVLVAISRNIGGVETISPFYVVK